MKIPAKFEIFDFREYERIGGRAVDFDFNHLFNVPDGIPGGSVDLG